MPKNGYKGLLCETSNVMGTTVTQLGETTLNVGIAATIGFFLGNPVAGISHVAARSLEAASAALAGVLNCGICVSECCCIENTIKNKLLPRRQYLLIGEDKNRHDTRNAQWKMTKAASDRCCRFGLSVAMSAAVAPVFGVDPASAALISVVSNAPAAIGCCTTDTAVICCTDNSIEEHVDGPTQTVVNAVLCCRK